MSIDTLRIVTNNNFDSLRIDVSRGLQGIQGETGADSDMLAATYDPNTVSGDAFDMGNMAEAADAKVLTADERVKIAQAAANAASGTDLNFSTDSALVKTLTGNTTFTFSNIAAGKTVAMHITGASAYGINWPTEVTWIDADPGNPADGVTECYMFMAASDTVVHGWHVEDVGASLLNAVRHDVSQTLTDGQVRQANTNIHTAFTFNVKHYGAKGDGVTNDTVALQACYDAAAATKGTAFHPVGTYMVDVSAQGISPLCQALNLHEGCSYVGESREGVILKLGDGVLLGTPVMLAPTGNSDNITVSDMTIDGNYANRAGNGTQVNDDSATGGEGINIKAGVGFTGRNVTIKDMDQDAFDLDDCFDFLMENCYAHGNWGNGLHAGSITNSGRGRVIGCRFERNGFGRTAESNPAGGMDIKGTYNVIIDDCIFVDNAYEIYASKGTFVVTGCIFLHNREESSLSYDCVNLYGDGTFNSCIFSWSFGDAIKQQLTVGGSGNGFTTVDNCFFYCGDTTLDGYHHLNGQNAKITNSYFKDCKRGIYLESEAAASNNIDIDGNRFEDCLTSAIEIADVTGGSITNNRMGGGGQGLYFTHTGATGWRVANNPELGGTYGVRYGQTQGGANTFINNYISQLYLKGSYGGSTFKGNHIAILWLKDQTQSNLFDGNTIDSNTVSGTYLQYQDFHNNDGAACDGLFSGGATLVAGTVTINTTAAKSTKKIRVWRETQAGSAVGVIAVGTITNGASFVINSLDSSASVETNDTSTVRWEFIK